MIRIGITMKKSVLEIDQFKIKADVPFENINIKGALCDKLGIKPCEINDIAINKLSIDSRKKPLIYYVLSVCFSVNDEKLCEKLLKNKKYSINHYNDVVYTFPAIDAVWNEKVNNGNRPVIVGMGPAGFVCAYFLAKAGLKPIVVERGSCVDKRIEDVNSFWNNEKELNPNSNIQFGEGGAGTFSDGKLQTGVKDKYGRIKEILRLFAENGAPDDILYLSKPHIGTDELTEMVKNIRNKIIDFGGEILFDTLFERIIVNDNMLTGAVIRDCKSQRIIKTDNLILATGHSARDTFKSLFESGINMTSKPFAVGLRVMHKQEVINEFRYGKDYPKFLPAADYKLTYNAADGKNVYSFCMCPGGYVVNASSEPGKTVVNGMSNHSRSGEYCNSAIVVSVDSDLFGKDIFSGMKFQEKLESKCHEIGCGKIPLEYFSDYKNNNYIVPNQKKDKTIDNYSGVGNLDGAVKGKYEYCMTHTILPEELRNDIIEGMNHFGKIISGFDSDDTLMIGVETRTSSPIRIPRDDDSFMCNIVGVYPCGEGAGYAGGITSAALDGLKVAEKVALRYNN